MAVDLSLAETRVGRIRRTSRGAMQEGGQSMVEVTNSPDGTTALDGIETWFVPKVMFDRYVAAGVEAHNAQEAMRTYAYEGRLPEGD